MSLPPTIEGARVSAESLMVLLALAIATNTVLVGAVIVVAAREGRSVTRGALPAAAHADPPAVPGAFGVPPPATALNHDDAPGRVTLTPGVPTAAYDRVVRVVSWAFILAIGAIVASSGLWTDIQTPIFILLGIAGLFVLVVHDLVPARFLGSARYLLEFSVAITLATLLVVMTGGAASPFFLAYALIVVGAALVLAPLYTLLVTATAIAGYLIGVLADPTTLPLSTPAIVAVGMNAATLVLLTYVGMVVAREQRHSRDAAIHLSTVDSLTGLYNRAYLFAAVDREIQRSARSGRGFCLLMMDLDALKPVNDRLGHFHGDRVLRGVGEIIRHGVRRIDTAARYGGDEFVVLLPETDPTGAFILAEKIRIGVGELAIETPTERIRTSVSIGVVSYPQDGRTADELMISADQAMYASKRRGKNRTVGLTVGGGSNGHAAGAGVVAGVGGRGSRGGSV